MFNLNAQADPKTESQEDSITLGPLFVKNYSNDAFRVLEYIDDNSTEEYGVCEFSGNQSEIAKNLGHSKVTVNRLIRQLQNDKLIRISNRTRGKYQVTEKGKELIKKMNNVL